MVASGARPLTVKLHLHDWLLARYRAFQRSYDPEAIIAGSGPGLVFIVTLALVGTTLVVGYYPDLAAASQLKHPWVAICFALLAAGSTTTAYRYSCRGPIGTIATLTDNMWWYFAFVYLSVNTAEAYALGFAIAYALAVVLVTARAYALTLLFGIVLLLPVVVLVPLYKPSATVALVLWVTAVLSLGISSSVRRRPDPRQRRSTPPLSLYQPVSAVDEDLCAVLLTSPPRIIVGKYRIERVLGVGGVGLVVAAQHLALGQAVALKFLRPAAACDARDLLRFQREAQTAVQLRNEHVCRVLDVGESEEGLPFIVLEYLEGRDLGQVLRSVGPLAIGEAVEYVLQVCEAVAEAHALGMVHRDLKPANFFLTLRHNGLPWVKVLDFGIARYKSELGQLDVRLTQTRSLLGSPVYMSPEQTRNARSVDPRSDIWSLGICLFELLTGRLPFTGETAPGVAAAVSTDPVPPIIEYRPDVPAALAHVVERCLTKRPEDRYPCIAELIRALEPFRAGAGQCDFIAAVRALNDGSRESTGSASRDRTLNSEQAIVTPRTRAGNLS